MFTEKESKKRIPGTIVTNALGSGDDVRRMHVALHKPAPSTHRYLGNGYLLQAMARGADLAASEHGTSEIQRTCSCGGGCGVCGAAKKAVVQTRLTVGRPDDVYEQEAERVAGAIMREPMADLTTGDALHQTGRQFRRLPAEVPGILRRQPLEEEEPYREAPEPIGLSAATIIEEGEEEQVAQAKLAPGATAEAAHASISSHSQGQPLSGSIQGFMQDRFGADFAHVRIHDNREAGLLAQKLHARAFTIGRDIYFGQGEFQPYAATGKHLLAHELTHVIQQGATTSRYPGIRRRPLAVQRSLSSAYSNYRGRCECGEDLGNNCAHYLSDALIRAGFTELDGDKGGLYRCHEPGVGSPHRKRCSNGRIVCKAGRPVRAKQLSDWFARKASKTNTSEPTGSSDYWAVYQERASDGQGHVLIHRHSGSGTRYHYQGTGDYPSWRTQNHYTW